MNTLKAWLSVHISFYIVFLLPPYYENTNKRLIKKPKLYFCDTGLACSLLGISSPQQLSTDRMRGHLFENAVLLERLKKRQNAIQDNDRFFYRDSNHNKIDLVETDRDGVRITEIKSSATYSSDFEKVLLKADTLFKAPVIERKIIYAGEYETTESKIKIIRYDSL